MDNQASRSRVSRRVVSRHLSVFLLVVPLSACRVHSIRVECYDADLYRFVPADRRVLQEIADQTVVEVRRLLPTLPQGLLLRVRPSAEGILAATGEGATSQPPNTVEWVFTPRDGVIDIARAHLRTALFHELHHLARFHHVASTALLDLVIAEGLATAFERDFAHSAPPWGEYGDEVSGWAKALIAMPRNEQWDSTFEQHPDGRLWIGSRTGTYLVDRAMRVSGRNSASLIAVPTDEIISMATRH